MPFSYDPTTTAGKVRLLIPDRVPEGAIFADDEIATFLTIEDDTIKRAAALALETIASDEALVQKVLKTQDLQTDGAKTADALLKRAKTLREQAKQEATTVAADEDDGAGYFAIAEQVVDVFSARRQRLNQALRDG